MPLSADYTRKLFAFDQTYLRQFAQKKYLIGIDEAGRGPIAGPVSVCLCLYDCEQHVPLDGVYDSKKISEKRRDLLFNQIIQSDIHFYHCFIDERTIDTLNIYQATQKGMELLLSNVEQELLAHSAIMTDAMPLKNYRVSPIVKGDSHSYIIAAASIIAKVKRDELMKAYAEKYPGYGFEQHKGYPTKKHIQAIHEKGILPIHRKTYEPIKRMYETNGFHALFQ